MGELLKAGQAAFSALKNLCVWNKANGGMGTSKSTYASVLFRPHVPGRVARGEIKRLAVFMPPGSADPSADLSSWWSCRDAQLARGEGYLAGLGGSVTVTLCVEVASLSACLDTSVSS
jgi:hypothetical protein